MAKTTVLNGLINQDRDTKSLGILVLRLSLAVTMLLNHGLPKYLSFSQKAAYFPDPLGVGSEISLMLVIFSELVCSFLLIFGVATRVVLIPLIITMGVAFFVFHSGDPFSKKELSFMFLMGYTSLFLMGGGAFSVCIDRFKKGSFLKWLLA